MNLFTQIFLLKIIFTTESFQIFLNHENVMLFSNLLANKDVCSQHGLC